MIKLATKVARIASHFSLHCIQMPENHTPDPNTKLGFIQAFRGIASLMVVLYHGSRFISPYGTGLGDLLFGAAGSMGVVLFFIVSGFIMVHTTARSGASPMRAAEFLVKRFSRVWPVYAVASAAFVLLVLHGPEFLRSPGHLRQLFCTLLFLPTGDGVSPDFGFPVPSVGWTLNYEMYFYVVFGLSMLFGPARWIVLAVWLGVTLLLVPYLHGGVTLDTYTDYGFKHAYVKLMTSPIVWQFAAGVAIGLIYHSRIAILDRTTLKWLLFAFVSFVVWQYMSRFRLGHGITEWGLSLIPMMLVFVLASKRVTMAVPGALTYLGDISFSLYLWHPLVQEGLPGPFVSNGYGNLTTGFPFLFLTTAIAVAVAGVSHRLLERGLAEYTKNMSLRRLRTRRNVTRASSLT
ncbi:MULTISPECIES: acyltransferase family protein [Paraburkholderia]|uniref:acyltransferase family protein n=1 Tax=Paraburkholderia TaxID=1822464 RepID=UPI001EF76DBA|nr:MULTISPECIES: acyltransferase [Paraburkholderia]